MWTTPEEAQRYQELTQILEETLREDAVLRAEQRVAPEDLALYLEWLELARETTVSVRPFLDKSSPYALRMLTYRQLKSDFAWLHHQIQGCAQAAAEEVGVAAAG
jgi:hypothetical protein